MLREWEINPRQIIFALVAAGVLFTLAAILYFTGLNGDLTSRVKILENVILESFMKNQELVLQSAQRIEAFAREIERDAQVMQADVKILENRSANIEERARVIEERAKSIEERSVNLQAVVEAGHKEIADRAEARHVTLEEHIKSTEENVRSLQGILQRQGPR